MLTGCIEYLKMSDNSSNLTCTPEDAKNVDTPLFATQYCILKGIFEYLPIRDLLSSCRVCKGWLEVGQVVRKQRKSKPHTLLWHPYGTHTSEFFEYYNDYSVSRATRQFILHTAPGMGFPSVQELTEEQSWSSLFPQLRSSILKFFFKHHSEPQLLFVTATAAVDEYIPSGTDP